MACVGGAKGGLPDPLFAGFPDGAGEAEESDTIIGGEAGAEFEVIKGGNRQHFNVGTVDRLNQDIADGGGDTALQEEVGGGLGMPTTQRTRGARESVWQVAVAPTGGERVMDHHEGMMAKLAREARRGSSEALRVTTRARISAWRLASPGVRLFLR